MEKLFRSTKAALVMMGVLLFGAGCNGEGKEMEIPRLTEIRKLPVGLRVSHSPNPVKATKAGRSGREFTWKYQTSLEAMAQELTIVEFGSFFEQGSNWRFANFTGKPFSRMDFAEWYSCPGAILVPGTAANDPENWGGGQQLRACRCVWYYIAVDDSGKRFYGESTVEQLGEIVERN